MKRILLTLQLLISMACSITSHKTSADYIDPFIGTDAHGHTFPGATVPFGLVQLSPDTGTEGWDWCSGYHSSDSSIMGFSHSHLSGTGASDLGDIMFMPVLKPKYISGSKENPDEGYRSRFSHESEYAEAGYYSVYLDDVRTKVELTASSHVGVQKYSFEDNDVHFVIVDLSHGLSDLPVECFVRKVSENAIEGYRRSSGWADDHTVFFYTEFSHPFEDMDVMADGVMTQDEAKAEKVISSLKFAHGVSDLVIKTGISYVDTDGAKQNLLCETGDMDFETVRKNAFDSWNKALATIEVQGNEDRKEIFYTAVYHSMIAPYHMSDADGRYRSSNRNVYKSNEPNYGLFSTWDTFRALHPLMTIIAPEINTQFVKSLIRYYEESGRLPVWDLNMRENFCMIGYHSIPIITDAYFKGEKFDYDKALEAMLRSSTEDTYLGLGNYRNYHYMPCDFESNSVSKALEFAYDDWCIAQFAKSRGKNELYEEYIKRAQYYKNHIDSVDTFMKGRDSHGRFRKNFSPTQIAILGQHDFTEGNSWHYSFFVPQDINTLIDLMGGDNHFIHKLDDLFNTETLLEDGSLPDLTGMIGNYSHGNEPSQHSAYLYAYAGQQWKTAEKVSKICSEMYANGRDGLCGNDDCGQMSAWYVMSAMGFYEVTPGSCIYVLGSPQFDKVTILNNNGTKFEIVTDRLSENSVYISDIYYNGKPYTKSYITHDMIVSGGTLDIKMRSKPNIKFGKDVKDRPKSRISDYVISSNEFLTDVTFSPYVDVDECFFKDEISVIANCEDDAVIYYTTNGTTPSVKSKIANSKFKFTDDCVLKLLAKSNITGKCSEVSTYSYNKGRIIDAIVKFPVPDKRFLGKGAKTLTDGLSGGNSLSSGGWLGWSGGNITLYVELPEERHVSYVGVDFLASLYDWIIPPSEFTVELEEKDGTTYSQKVMIPDEICKENKTYLFGAECNVRTKKIKIVIPENIMPSWHSFHGNPAWVFIDEVLVK